MQTLMRAIKSAVALLGNDREPEELNMRACMGLTTQLLKDLRNTVVESGQYNEQVSSHTSKVLAECRLQLALLVRSVPCHAEGGKVSPEVQRCFLRVMNSVIMQFDKIIKESLDDQNLRDQDPQNVLRGDLKKINHNLKLFKKLTASKKQAAKRSRKTEYLESDLKLKKSKEHNEQPKTSRTSLQSEFNTFRGVALERSKMNYDSLCEIPYCRSKGIQSKANKSETFESSTTESQQHLQASNSSTSSDSLYKDLSEMESNVAIVGSYQNLCTQDMQVSWTNKGQPMNRREYSLPDFNGQTEFEETADLIQNIESQRSLSMQNQQELQVVWVQKEKPIIQTSSTCSDCKYTELPLLVKDESRAEIPQDLQIQRGFTSSHPRLKKLPQIDESELNLRIASRLKEQTVSASSDFLFKDLPKSETVENRSSWISENSVNLPTSSNVRLENLPQPEKEESQASWITESPQDSQVLCAQEDNTIIQTGSTASDLIFKNLRDQGLETLEKMESRPDLEVLLSKIQTSSTSTSTSPKPEKDKSQMNMATKRPQDLRVYDKASTSSDFISKDLSQPEKDESKPSLGIESLEVGSPLKSQIDKPRTQTSATSSDLKLRNMTELELESNMALAGSIQNIRSRSSFRQDLPALWKDKPLYRVSFNVSDFLSKDIPQREKVESKTCLTPKSVTQVQDIWARKSNPMVLTSSFSDFSDRKTNTQQVSSKPTLANTSQLSVTRQEQSRNLEISKPKSAESFFSLGKTFGDHRLRLLRWCQEITKDYGIPMYEFSESWRSGRALVAVIHSYREDLIEDRFNPKGETKESPRNMLMCGAKAAKSLGVNSKVDIVRVCLKRVPDFYQVFTFVGELYSCLEPKLT